MMVPTTSLKAIADRSILRIFSSLGMCWLLNRLFQQVTIAPSAHVEANTANGFLIDSMTISELENAIRLRNPKIWENSTNTEYTSYGLPADTAECYAIAEERGVTVLSDSGAARAFSSIGENVQLLDRGDLLEHAALRGILEQSSAAQLYNVEIPKRFSRPLRKRFVDGKVEYMRLLTHPPRQEWVSIHPSLNLTIVPPHSEGSHTRNFNFSDLSSDS